MLFGAEALQNLNVKKSVIQLPAPQFPGLDPQRRDRGGSLKPREGVPGASPRVGGTALVPPAVSGRAWERAPAAEARRLLSASQLAAPGARTARCGGRARWRLACPRRGGKLSWEKLGAAGARPGVGTGKSSGAREGSGGSGETRRPPGHEI